LIQLLRGSLPIEAKAGTVERYTRPDVFSDFRLAAVRREFLLQWGFFDFFFGPGLSQAPDEASFNGISIFWSTYQTCRCLRHFDGHNVRIIVAEFQIAGKAAIDFRKLCTQGSFNSGQTPEYKLIV
jgi:hypothetical protein